MVKIQGFETDEETMEFINARLEIDPGQVFRVLGMMGMNPTFQAGPPIESESGTSRD